MKREHNTKQPWQMTAEEFLNNYPLFSELTSREKWRCYRVQNNNSVEETGEEISYSEFVRSVTEDFSTFRWDKEDMSLLINSDHSYFVQQALDFDEDIPGDVLAEYPDLVEEHINRLVKKKRNKSRREERWAREKEDRDFWKQFEW